MSSDKITKRPSEAARDILIQIRSGIIEIPIRNSCIKRIIRIPTQFSYSF